jgi:ribosomal protein S27AE
MLNWYIQSADDEGTCPKCGKFLLQRKDRFGEPERWECGGCGYRDNGVHHVEQENQI